MKKSENWREYLLDLDDYGLVRIENGKLFWRTDLQFEQLMQDFPKLLKKYKKAFHFIKKILNEEENAKENDIKILKYPRKLDDILYEFFMDLNDRIILCKYKDPIIEKLKQELFTKYKKRIDNLLWTTMLDEKTFKFLSILQKEIKFSYKYEDVFGRSVRLQFGGSHYIKEEEKTREYFTNPKFARVCVNKSEHAFQLYSMDEWDEIEKKIAQHGYNENYFNQIQPYLTFSTDLFQIQKKIWKDSPQKIKKSLNKLYNLGLVDIISQNVLTVTENTERPVINKEFINILKGKQLVYRMDFNSKRHYDTDVFGKRIIKKPKWIKTVFYLSMTKNGLFLWNQLQQILEICPKIKNHPPLINYIKMVNEKKKISQNQIDFLLDNSLIANNDNVLNLSDKGNKILSIIQNTDRINKDQLQDFEINYQKISEQLKNIKNFVVKEEFGKARILLENSENNFKRLEIKYSNFPFKKIDFTKWTQFIEEKEQEFRIFKVIEELSAKFPRILISEICQILPAYEVEFIKTKVKEFIDKEKIMAKYDIPTLSIIFMKAVQLDHFIANLNKEFEEWEEKEIFKPSKFITDLDNQFSKWENNELNKVKKI